ncbi:small subunit ribosomal protein S16 [Arthrobacter sp. CAN_A1]
MTTTVAVKIRLKRMGKIRAPFYRVVVMDARAKRDGRALEEIGKYNPTEEPSFIEIKSDRAQYWLGVGAQPTEQVAVLLKITGDWQKFKGLEGQEGTLKTKAPKETFVAPEKGSVIVPEAITPKAKKSDAEAPAEAEAETAEAK